jgi:hypothetical protein
LRREFVISGLFILKIGISTDRHSLHRAITNVGILGDPEEELVAEDSYVAYCLPTLSFKGARGSVVG